MKPLKLGVIGLSDGNGHPYSWSAIFNGYHPEKMSNCPFPVIPQYLAKESWPRARIPNAQVSHIWTQSLEVSRRVAEAVHIPNVIENMEVMIPDVDAVLLARDDAENHMEMAKPFLEAGLPIYIDKPLAFNVEEAQELFTMEEYAGQIFTCSAFQFAQELRLTGKARDQLGQIKTVEAQIKKDWAKYAIHMIEPVLKITGVQEIEGAEVSGTAGEREVTYTFEDGVKVKILTSETQDLKPIIKVIGEKSSIELEFRNTFSAFKLALEVFIASVREKKPKVDQSFILKSIEMVEVGCGK